jgi:putative ABC transport system permease protein
MSLRIILLQFWRDVRAQRLRTLLTLFGLAWGTFCVVVLLSFGEGLSRKQQARGAALGDRIILLIGGRTSIPHEGLPRGRSIALADEDADAIRGEVAGVVAVSPEYTQGAMARVGTAESATVLCGVRPCFARMRKLEPERGGRFINARDEQERRRVVVIGARVRRDLFGERQAVGEQIELEGIPFLVVGTLAEKDQDSSYNGPDDGKVFIPASVARASFGMVQPDLLIVEIANGASGSDVLDGLIPVMARLHHFDPGDREALIWWDASEMVAMFTAIFIGFQGFLALLGSLTLAVAGIGISNTMSMVVEDRTSQIGIAMALGARRGWVLGQIMLETLCFVVVGGGAGVLFAAGVVALGQQLPMTGDLGSPVFSPTIAALTAGLLGLIGILSGMGPARRAAYLNPAEALRS